MPYTRVLSDLFLIFSIFAFPFWVPLVVGAFFLFKFRYFYEYVAVMFFFDLLYGGGVLRILGLPFALTITALIIYFAVERLREHLLLYTE